MLGLKFSDAQTLVFDEYFEGYLQKPLTKFIDVVSDPNEKEIRAALIYYSSKLPFQTYQSILEMFYPARSTSSFDLARQHDFFKRSLLDLCKFCNCMIDFGHDIYTHCFDIRITPEDIAELDTNTKKFLVADYFRTKIHHLLESKGYQLNNFTFELSLYSPNEKLILLTSTVQSKTDSELSASTKLKVRSW
ncbi:MAG: hypothetical protein JSR17_07045 [Proteobacteria bacterium]|nr:hypothetical protein [Pseudomonadota bacterium]